MNLSSNNLIIIIIFSLFSLGNLFFLYKKMNNGFGPVNLKVYGLTILIAITALLALSDVEAQKLVATYSILGAIAGYLFGLKND
ncbi:MAG: hypothetical protein QM541_16040 [Flavobacterium sp.]|nr:hypothetical protein [Flavobacterium sp.]